MAPPANVLAELKQRGLIPRECVPIETVHPGRTPSCIREGTGRIVKWSQPIPGNLRPFDGFDPRDVPNPPVNLCKRVGWMAEVRSRDGVEWKMARVLHSQPHGRWRDIGEGDALIDANVRLHIVEQRHLSWHSDEHMLCLMQAPEPIPFDVFRRTFRYWLILNVMDPRHDDEWQLRGGLLPATLPQPDPKFFDLLFCADETSVRFGLDDTGDRVYGKLEFPKQFIERETFACLWGQYRFWASWRPLLRICRVIARLKFKLKDLKDHAPPDGIKFRETIQTTPFVF